MEVVKHTPVKGTRCVGRSHCVWWGLVCGYLLGLKKGDKCAWRMGRSHCVWAGVCGWYLQGLKKGDKGLCLIAGDIYPIDVISHLAVLCEEKDTPYIYVPSKHDLGE